MNYPQRAISIQQPWSWLIVNNHKPIENRTWTHPFRGAVLVHAGKKMDMDAHADLLNGYHPVTGDAMPATAADYIRAWRAGEVHTGGFVGMTHVIGYVDGSSDPWFVGPIGFTLKDGQPLPFVASRGALGFYSATYQPPGDAP
jgi:hypothetical protein